MNDYHARDAFEDFAKSLKSGKKTTTEQLWATTVLITMDEKTPSDIRLAYIENLVIIHESQLLLEESEFWAGHYKTAEDLKKEGQ
jgi:hypothetical protein